MNRRQQEVIEYLKEENRVLREHVGRQRFPLTDEQKRHLATKGKIIGRKLLEQFGTLFNQDTILKWHRILLARKYDGADHRAGARVRGCAVQVEAIQAGPQSQEIL